MHPGEPNYQQNECPVNIDPDACRFSDIKRPFHSRRLVTIICGYIFLREFFEVDFSIQFDRFFLPVDKAVFLTFA
jgi:hypothetical protein